jgi:hypothetical protein
MIVEEAKKVLRDNGYFVDNLWHIDDVKTRYKCDDETAQDILNGALTNGYIMEQINEAIIEACEDDELEEVDEE